MDISNPRQTEFSEREEEVEEIKKVSCECDSHSAIAIDQAMTFHY